MRGPPRRSKLGTHDGFAMTPAWQDDYDDAMFAFSTGDYPAAITKLDAILAGADTINNMLWTDQVQSGTLAGTVV